MRTIGIGVGLSGTQIAVVSSSLEHRKPNWSRRKSETAVMLWLPGLLIWEQRPEPVALQSYSADDRPADEMYQGTSPSCPLRSTSRHYRSRLPSIYMLTGVASTNASWKSANTQLRELALVTA